LSDEPKLPAPFLGQVSFSIAVSALGARVARTAVLAYRYAPDWPQLDPATGQLVQTPPKLECDLGFRLRDKPPGALTADGLYPVPGMLPLLVLNKPMCNALWMAVDNDARRQEGELRRTLGFPGPDPDDWL
jgi:hypothetical protein